jgi:opacity protein-like surface antigen
MNILPMLIVAGALLATTSVSAQTRRANNDRVADQLNAQVLEVLRAGRAPVAPVAVTSPVLNSPTTTVTATAPRGVYLGANAGSNFRTGSDYQVGGSLGYQFTPTYAVEVTYDYNDITRTTNSQAVMLNGVYSRRLGASGFTPYALAGAGMGWNGLGVSGTGSNATLYNVGAGMRVNVSGPVDLDLRYRYMAPVDFTNGYTQHALTGGLRINF